MRNSLVISFAKGSLTEEFVFFRRIPVRRIREQIKSASFKKLVDVFI